ncbi:MAG: hypothetical protein JW774_01260 [Candidatus Aureabacteria bacterium]|nr:hypothetical protein [Candidatus Auribacterota bacterium]
MKKVNSCLMITLTAILLIPLSILLADEIKDSINDALQKYDQGDYSGAAGMLDYAAQLIRQKKAEQLKAFLPKAPDGWTSNDAATMAMEVAMFGGGSSAERQYTKDTSSVSVKIMTDSPYLPTMMMMMTNPAMAASDGGKLTKIKNQQAIIKYIAEVQSGDINIVVANRYLVTVSGTQVSLDILKSFAEDIDYTKLT